MGEGCEERNWGSTAKSPAAGCFDGMISVDGGGEGGEQQMMAGEGGMFRKRRGVEK